MARLAQRLGLTRYEADEFYKQALEAYEKKDLEAALLAMSEAIALLPTNSEYYAARGFFYLEDGVKPKAREDFDQALEIYPYESLAHYGRGMLTYQEKNWEEAVAHFTEAYRANPERPETLYYLALAHHHNGENEKAQPLMEQARAKFEADNDRRRTDAAKWTRELDKLIRQSRLMDGR